MGKKHLLPIYIGTVRVDLYESQRLEALAGVIGPSLLFEQTQLLV